MSAIVYPSWFRNARFTAKAEWIKARLGCTYEQACAMIGRRPKRRAVRPTVAEYQERLAKQKLS